MIENLSSENCQTLIWYDHHNGLENYFIRINENIDMDFNADSVCWSDIGKCCEKGD